MSLRQTRWMLRLLIALLWCGAAGAIAFAVISGETSREQLIVAKPRRVEPLEQTEAATLSFDSLWDAELRGPLVDPPPPPPKPKPKPVVTKQPPKPKPKAKPKPAPPPKLDVELVGTIIESGRPLAIVVDASGNIDMKAPGQVFDLEPEGLTLASVDDRSATVVLNDRETTLQLPIRKTTSAADDRKQRKRERAERKPTATVSPSNVMQMRNQMRSKPKE